LAKTASNMQKPDGCVVIEDSDIPQKLFSLKLRALNGIGHQMEARLNRYKIETLNNYTPPTSSNYALHGAA